MEQRSWLIHQPDLIHAHRQTRGPCTLSTRGDNNWQSPATALSFQGFSLNRPAFQDQERLSCSPSRGAAAARGDCSRFLRSGRTSAGSNALRHGSEGRRGGIRWHQVASQYSTVNNNDDRGKKRERCNNCRTLSSLARARRLGRARAGRREREREIEREANRKAPSVSVTGALLTGNFFRGQVVPARHATNQAGRAAGSDYKKGRDCGARARARTPGAKGAREVIRSRRVPFSSRVSASVHAHARKERARGKEQSQAALLSGACIAETAACNGENYVALGGGIKRTQKLTVTCPCINCAIART